ncbi:MAG: NADH:ubiquinone reductase (Na(+)-transporting) subunit D [Bacteroidales bacterium]
MSIVEKKKDPLFGSREIKLLKTPFSKENPVIVQVLGICSALAVTVKLQPAVVMAISVTVVIMMSNLIISIMRNTIPPRIRIIVQLVVVSFLVIIVDQLLKAFAYDVSKQLSVYVGLIITNCIVMGRLEAFAMSNRPGPSVMDGLGNGLGYGIILIIIGFIRELFGSGTLWDIRIMPNNYVPNGLMVMPAMALILLGIIIWIHRNRNKELVENE